MTAQMTEAAVCNCTGACMRPPYRCSSGIGGIGGASRFYSVIGCEHCDTGGCSGRCQMAPLYQWPPVLDVATERKGWVCPKCNSGVSPDEKCCPCGGPT